MEEKSLIGYQNPALIEYYENHIKQLDPGQHSSDYLDIDLSGGKSIDFDELNRFMEQFRIRFVNVIVDDVTQLGINNQERNSILNNLPLVELRGLQIQGNLDGLEIPDKIPVTGANNEASLDNLMILRLKHTKEDPAKVGKITVGREWNVVGLDNVGEIEGFAASSQRKVDHDFEIHTKSKEDIDWSKVENKEYVTSISFDEKLEPTRENIDFLLEMFPHTNRTYFKNTEETPEVKDPREAALLLTALKKVKMEQGSFEEIKNILSEANKQEIIHNIVPYPDGTYYDISEEPKSTKEEVLESLNNPDREETDTPLVIQINGLKDLSTDEVKELMEKAGDQKVAIAFNGPEVPYYSQGSYSLEHYLAIREKVNELMEGIDESMPEMERFAELYKRVSTAMYYDTPAWYRNSYEDTIYSRSHFHSASNFDSLMEGKGICGAYSFILKNLCELQGIECKQVQGPVYYVAYHKKDPDAYIDPDRPEPVNKELPKDRFITNGGHAWNKVKLDGVWYNVDATLDHHDFKSGQLPTFALLSDKTLLRTGSRESTNSPKCTTDYPEDKLASLFGVEKKQSIFRKISDFIYGRRNPMKRELYYDPDVLEFTTGEKLSDIRREGKPSFRERLARLFGIKNKALPEPQNLESRSDAEKENFTSKKPDVWELSEEARSKINVEEAVKQTEHKAGIIRDEKHNIR